jgi:hypothetical protein
MGEALRRIYALAPVCFAVLLCLPQCVAIPTSPHQRRLLPQSIRLFAIDRAYDVCNIEQPWLSGHELLHFGRHGVLLRYDISEKTDTPTPALTRQVLQTPRPRYSRLDVSPNGKWIVWSGVDHIYAVSTDGRIRLSWPLSDVSYWNLYWCADSHHVLAQADGWNVAYEYDVHSPHVKKTLRVPKELVLGVFLSIGAVISDQEIIACPMQVGGMVSLGDVGDEPRFPRVLSTWSLYHSSPLKTSTFLLLTFPEAIVPSPVNDRVAWLMSLTGGESLWISHGDGGQVTNEIGVVSLRRKDGYLNGVKWSPDEKWISFDSHRALWIVRVH